MARHTESINMFRVCGDDLPLYALVKVMEQEVDIIANGICNRKGLRRARAHKVMVWHHWNCHHGEVKRSVA